MYFEEYDEDSDVDDGVQNNFDKVISTNTTNRKWHFVYQSPNIQRLDRRSGSRLILLDGTYRITK